MAVNEKLLEQAKARSVDTRLLINGVAKRAGEIARGARALVPVNPQDELSHLDIALMEVAQGLIVIRGPSEE